MLPFLVFAPSTAQKKNGLCLNCLNAKDAHGQTKGQKTHTERKQNGNSKHRCMEQIRKQNGKFLMCFVPYVTQSTKSMQFARGDTPLIPSTTQPLHYAAAPALKILSLWVSVWQSDAGPPKVLPRMCTNSTAIYSPLYCLAQSTGALAGKSKTPVTNLARTALIPAGVFLHSISFSPVLSVDRIKFFLSSISAMRMR